MERLSNDRPFQQRRPQVATRREQPAARGSLVPRGAASGAPAEKLASALLEALGSSLDLRVVLERAYPLLLRLIPADYGALGISSSGRAEDYQWIVANVPSAFFAAYPSMASHDFVRTAVAARPNAVLRDHEMIARSALEKNVMYRRAREVGAPLEQVMSVMLHIDDRWQSGLSLYREQRRPFSAREALALQQVTPAIVNAVRNCHVFGAAASWGAALDALLRDQVASMLLVAPPATEVARTAGATALIDKWFSPRERRGTALPTAITDFVVRATGRGGPSVWTVTGPDSILEVVFTALPERLGRASGAVLLREVPNIIPIPRAWRAILTAREAEVSEGVVRGWDNRTIATELGCAEATVKRHLQNVFDKLGISSRTALVSHAARPPRR